MQHSPVTAAVTKVSPQVLLPLQVIAPAAMLAFLGRTHPWRARVNGAPLRVVRQRLGLSTDTPADVLGVDRGATRRWEVDRSTMAPGSVADVLAPAERTDALGTYADERVGQDHPCVLAYPNDAAFWAAEPDPRSLLAAWHRSIIARALARRPDAEVVHFTRARHGPGLGRRSQQRLPSGGVQRPKQDDQLGWASLSVTGRGCLLVPRRPLPGRKNTGQHVPVETPLAAVLRATARSVTSWRGARP